VRISRYSGAVFCGGFVVEQTSNIDVDAVSDRNELQHQCQSCESKERAPEVFESELMVNVTDVAEAIGNSSQAKGKRNADGGNQPSNDKRDPEEHLARVDFPADLQVQGKSSPEYPDDTSPTSKDEEGATEGAREA